MTWEWILIALAILIVLFYIATYIVYRIVFYRDRKMSDNEYDLPAIKQINEHKDFMYSLIDEMKKLECEDINILAKDGTKLSARYYHVSDDAPIQIQCHGYKGNAYRDFCGGNKLSREKGHNALVIEHRGHGRSGGNTISFGIIENKDVLCWIEYLVDRFGKDTKIILTGVSMGAATVLMTLQHELPKNVVCVIADCPYASVKEIIDKVCKDDLKLPPKLVFPLIYCAGLFWGHFDMLKGDVRKAVKNAKVPVLIIHGKADGLIPYSHSEEIYQNIPSFKKLALFDGAGHGLSYIVDPTKYVNVIDEFSKENNL